LTVFLQEPRFVGVSESSPEWFEIQRDVIRSRPLMSRCYALWYRQLLQDVERVPPGPGHLLELGSGGSFLKDHCPGLITSDVVAGFAERVIDARELPFEDASVRGIFLTHAFHHIPDVERFLREAVRVLVPGGVIAMIEVAHTPFARFFFDRFHPEPYDDGAETWTFDQADAMMDSNQALSWIVFERDRARFESLFPELEILASNTLPWFSYLASGGVTRRNLVPAWLAPAIGGLDRLLAPLDPLMSLHWHLAVQKRA
jgi:SAM-dependent methyltransferase